MSEDPPPGVRVIAANEITREWVNDHSDEMWIPADGPIKLWGPSVLKALQKGTLKAFTFGDDPRPVIKYKDLLDWMAAVPGRLERMQRYARRN